MVDEINEQIEKNPDLQKSLEKSDVDVTPRSQKRPEPVYKIINQEQKIPVSRHHGKVWKARRDRGLKKRKDRYEDKWEESVRYYNADQSAHRDQTGEDTAQNISVDEQTKVQNSHTENIVFSNVSALVPAIYAKNPTVETTHRTTGNEDIANDLEVFMNNMLTRKAYPKLPIKTDARRSVVCTALTNVSYIEVGYTRKAETSEQALTQLQELADKLAEAKSSEEVETIEGQIMAIEDKIDFLRPEGPWSRFLSPKQVVRDPACTAEHLRDDKWIMVWEYLPTKYLQAVYGTEQNGETRMLFAPTHVLPAEKNDSGNASGRNAIEAEIESFELLNNESKAGDYGYNDDESYKDAQMTKVWKVWDKTTRRLYMYADNNWEWPVWVWNDPYNLVDFFPIAQLVFYTDPLEGIGNSEVSYYLDQQDSVNEKSSELRTARRHAKYNLVYDKDKVLPTDVEKMLNSTRPRALGIEVPEGLKIQDVIQALVPPSIQYTELFDKRDDIEAVYRISSVSQSMTGSEFRTNTTNRAIEYYNSSQATRLDEKIDAIEDFISDICWMTLQMCVQFMPKELVAQVAGDDVASRWQQMSSSELQTRIGSIQVVGGSTQKPNSHAKQQMAIEIGQVLGQFASAMPPVAMVLLKTLERAFDEVIITREEWDMINQSLGQAMQQQAGQPQQQQPGQGQPSPEEILQQLPPEAQEAVARAVEQGVPLEEAIMRIVEAMQQQPQQPTQ